MAERRDLNMSKQTITDQRMTRQSRECWAASKVENIAGAGLRAAAVSFGAVSFGVSDVRA